MISSDCDEVPTEAETRSQCRRRRAVVTRCLVPLAGGASVPFAGSSHERSRELLGEAFDVGMYHIRCTYSWCSNIAPQFLCFVILDHFNNDPVATPIHATRPSTCDFVTVSLRRGKGTNSGADHEQ